jgi:hypothetical protein
VLDVASCHFCTWQSERLAADEGYGLSLDRLQGMRQFLAICRRKFADMAVDGVNSVV